MPQMIKQPIDLILGFGGMHPDENTRAKHWAAVFEPFMLLIAFWTLLEWHLSSKGLLSESHSMLANWLIWAFFFIETLTLSILSDQPLRYIMRNWAHLVIIFLGFPLFYESANRVGILRMIRLLLLFGFITHNIHTLKNLLSQNHLGKTLLVGVVLILASGIFIATIDPSIETPADGIWWAWVTVTTVGYGDIVPSSGEGRVFASLLILFGIGLVSLITANLSAYLLSKGMKQELQYEKEELRKLRELEAHVRRLESKIDQLLDNPNERSIDKK